MIGERESYVIVEDGKDKNTGLKGVLLEEEVSKALPSPPFSAFTCSSTKVARSQVHRTSATPPYTNVFHNTSF